MRNWSTDSAWVVSNHPAAPFNDRRLDDCNLDLKLWQLARASSAVPVYYLPETIRFGRNKPYEFVFVDGGRTGFLNPAFKAFQFATTQPYGVNWPVGEEDVVLVSVGSGDTGHKRIGKPASDITVARGEGPAQRDAAGHDPRAGSVVSHLRTLPDWRSDRPGGG